MIQSIFTLTHLPGLIFTRFIILTLCSAILIWGYSVIRCKLTKRENTFLRATIGQSLIEGALLCIIILALYLIFFIKASGWQRFVWDEWYWSFSRNTYLMLLPEIITFTTISIFFFIQTNKLSNLLKNK